MILVLAELIVPGLVVVFLGLAAILVALGIYMGWLDGWMQMMTAWFIISLVLVLSLRSLCARFAPGSREQGNLDEDADAYGTVVEVASVEADPKKGRIRFRGTTWDAESLELPLKAGDKVRLLGRENLVWVVEPQSPDDLDDAWED